LKGPKWRYIAKHFCGPGRIATDAFSRRNRTNGKSIRFHDEIAQTAIRKLSCFAKNAKQVAAWSSGIVSD
jgi:hypothetical protein